VISDAAPALTSVKARLTPGAVSAFAINIAGTGLAFLSQLVLARVLVTGKQENCHMKRHHRNNVSKAG
jgi:hypothetical protein